MLIKSINTLNKEYYFMKYLVTTSLLLSLMCVSPVFADSYTQTAAQVARATAAAGYAEDAYDCVTNPTVEQCAASAAKAATTAAVGAAAVPTAVAIVSASGATATTGTAIAALSGAAATSSTLYVIGAPVAAALGIATSPAWIGGAIVTGAALGVAAGINWLFFD
jgi:hypothetical protein